MSDMKIRIMFYLAFVAVICGCIADPLQDTKPERKPDNLPEIRWNQTGGLKVTNILHTDSCGCKVYEIERSNCWVYVNNNGGIAVLPKQ